MKSNGARNDFAGTGKIRCPEIGLTFPQLFRVTSYEWELSADKSTLLATDRPAPIRYTLDHQKIWQLHANPTFTPIDAPDPRIDEGWLVIRYHRSDEQAASYFSAVIDLEGLGEGYDWSGTLVSRRREQVFTVVHRPAISGKPSPAFIYCAQIPHELIGWNEWGVGVTADGLKLSIDDLYPFD